MASDETYLESFIESISTLPSEIRRNLGLIKSLDQSYASITHQLREAEEDYLQGANEFISNLPIRLSQPSTEESELPDSPPTKRAKLNPKSDTDDDSTNVSTSSAKINDSNATVDDSCRTSITIQKKGGIVVPSTTKNDSDTSTSTEDQLVIPTTEELRQSITDSNALANIAILRRDSRQFVDEKVLVAEQTYSIVDEAIKRLDRDIEKFEGLLKGTGQFNISAGAQPDDLAAIQVTPNSPDWILAKVISHDIQTGFYRLSDEDIESNKTFTLPENRVVILGGVDRLSRGDIIFAVYPDTTSFYQATVVQAPRQVAGGDESFVMVNFKDDGDNKFAVLMKHVMRVPYGAIQ